MGVEGSPDDVASMGVEQFYYHSHNLYYNIYWIYTLFWEWALVSYARFLRNLNWVDKKEWGVRKMFCMLMGMSLMTTAVMEKCLLVLSWIVWKFAVGDGLVHKFTRMMNHRLSIVYWESWTIWVYLTAYDSIYNTNTLFTLPIFLYNMCYYWH